MATPNAKGQSHCSRCEEWKPATAFYPVRRGDYSKVSSMCKPCYKATYTSDYRNLLKEKA